MNLILTHLIIFYKLQKVLVKMNTCRQRAILTIDASDKSLPRLLICASDRERAIARLKLEALIINGTAQPDLSGNS